jgi:ribosomal protein S18 acetylase RimI-like enzyme
MNTYHEIVQANLSAFWQQCMLTHPDYQMFVNSNIEYTKTGINDPLCNAVLSSNLAENEISDAVEQLSQYYGEQTSQGWWVNLLSDSPQLMMELERKNWIALGEMSGMIMNLDAVEISQEVPTDFDVFAVHSEFDLKDWMMPIKTSFGMSEYVAEKYQQMMTTLFNAQQSLHFVAKLGEKMIGSSTLFLGDHAGIYNCATLPEYRGQGVLRFLTNAMMVQAKKMGYQYVTLQASPLSVNIFKKCGFESVVPYKVYGVMKY